MDDIRLDRPNTVVVDPQFGLGGMPEIGQKIICILDQGHEHSGTFLRRDIEANTPFISVGKLK